MNDIINNFAHKHRCSRFNQQQMIEALILELSGLNATLNKRKEEEENELNADWGDYEEPKEYWYINEFGTPTKADFVGRETLYDKCRKNFGNYFKSKEAAEKAVEKLKAWKRLEAEIVGWSFSYNLDLEGCGFNDEDIVVGIKLQRNTSEKDLDLLFGGEE